MMEPDTITLILCLLLGFVSGCLTGWNLRGVRRAPAVVVEAPLVEAPHPEWDTFNKRHKKLFEAAYKAARAAEAKADKE